MTIDPVIVKKLVSGKSVLIEDDKLHYGVKIHYEIYNGNEDIENSIFFVSGYLNGIAVAHKTKLMQDQQSDQTTYYFVDHDITESEYMTLRDTLDEMKSIIDISPVKIRVAIRPVIETNTLAIFPPDLPKE